jgi:hypothetical protein
MSQLFILRQNASQSMTAVECVWNVMAHAQKPDFVFRRNGRVHLNRQGRQFSRLLAAEVCASAVVMLDTPCSDVVWMVRLPTPFANFPFTFPPVRHRVPSHFNWTPPEILENGTPNTRLHVLELHLTTQHCSATAIRELLQRVAAPTVLIRYFLQTLIMSPRTDPLRRRNFKFHNFSLRQI